MSKVSDEHTFLVCGGMIEENQFVEVLKNIQTDLCKNNPGQGFETLKWRYKMNFEGDTFNELMDVYDFLIEDLKNLPNKNSRKSFLKDIESYLTRYSNSKSTENEFLTNLYQKISNIPDKKFDISRQLEYFEKLRSGLDSKIFQSGNIGYLWVSDSRVFEYLSPTLDQLPNLGEYLNYLYVNDKQTFNEIEDVYYQILKQKSEKEAVEYLERIYQEQRVSKFSTVSRIFAYEYNLDQKTKYGNLFTPSKPSQCGKYLTLNSTQGYIEFNKAKININDKNDKKYLIASNPGNIPQQELINKIGIFDVNVIQSDSSIILSDKTPGKRGLIFFNAIYSSGIKVIDENNNIQLLKFNFQN